MYYNPEQIIQYTETLLLAQATTLGLAYVSIAANAELLIPAYPAALITAGSKAKEMSGQKFRVGLSMEIFVLHGLLSDTIRDRTMADLALATSIETLLDKNMTMGGNIINGFVVGSDPGNMVRGSTTGIITTKLTWTGESRQTFPV